MFLVCCCLFGDFVCVVCLVFGLLGCMVVGCLLYAFVGGCCLLFVECCLLFADCCLLFVVPCSLFVVLSLLCVIRCSLLVVFLGVVGCC